MASQSGARGNKAKARQMAKTSAKKRNSSYTVNRIARSKARKDRNVQRSSKGMFLCVEDMMSNSNRQRPAMI